MTINQTLVPGIIILVVSHSVISLTVSPISVFISDNEAEVISPQKAGEGKNRSNVPFVYSVWLKTTQLLLQFELVSCAKEETLYIQIRNVNILLIIKNFLIAPTVRVWRCGEIP